MSKVIAPTKVKKGVELISWIQKKLCELYCCMGDDGINCYNCLLVNTHGHTGHDNIEDFIKWLKRELNKAQKEK